MNHLPFTLVAYFLNSVAVLVDKFMVTKHIPNPLLYVFYLSLLSLVMLLGLPLTRVPTLAVFALASISTLLWTTGWYYMFKGLQVGVASRVIPIIGALIPIILLVEGLVSASITRQQGLAAAVLTLGLVFLTAKDWGGKISKQEVVFELLSAVLFAVSYLFLREAYVRENFLTVLVWSRMILLPVGLGLVLLPFTRKVVLSRSGRGGPGFKFNSKPGLLFLGGQAAGAGSELLLTYSVSLASPALVNSLQGSQYVFLLVFSLFLAKKFPEVFQEHSTLLGNLCKALGIVLIAIGLYMLAFYR